MDLKGIYHFHRIDKKSRKRDSGQIFIKISLLFQVAFFLIANTACVPSGENSGGRKSKSNAATTNTPANTGTPSAPNFSSSNNFFQNGSVTSLTSFTIDSTFADSFYLRGAEINNYLANGNTEATCLVFNFPNVNAQSRTLVLTGSPQNFINFATKLKENYYLVEPTNKGLNQTFCQNPGIINYIGLKYPTSTIVYNLAELCPNCTTFLLDSGPLELVTKAGQLIAEIKTNYLDLRVKTQGTLLNDDSGQGCLSSSECVLKGFDCCSGGQCVKDLSLKSGTNTSSTDFLQASNDIALNPSNIYNYPNFYHICAKVVVPTPTPVPTVNPDDASNQRLSMLKELYECSSLVLGEMSVCSKTYYEASKNTGPYKTGKDDRNFLTTYSGNKTMSPNSITEIYHAGELIYKNGSGLTSGISVGQGNDNLSDVTNVTLTRAKPVSAKNDDLKIKYMIDGSCTFINSALAKCSKYYVQGQNLGKIDDHYPASNKFALPLYIDTTRIINVEVDGTNKVGETDWDLVIASPSYVQFKGPGGSTSLQVFDTQKIKINFFVDMAQNNVLQSKLEALNSIDSLCNCGGPYCSLKEVMINTNGIDKVADYACVYPDNSAAPPLQQTIYLSSKTIPHRYFDKEGVHQTNIDLNTPEQEGTKFSYTGKNLLRPNNLTQYVGFNEIYGSMSSDPTGAKPAKEVVVKSGKTYDIFIDYGTFSTCPSCGNDYFSTLAKVFPTNFTNKGGGYRPEKTITNRQKSQTYRGDDLLFGRACFIPATMIPWSHNKNPDRANQRLGRLAAQHFFFANGYQRDWFGFDYGSIIGSFDGVTWFAVGNQRRIKANGNRLYLAVNAYFGDQTLDNNFTITISEANLIVASGSQVTSDDQSDGAECRKYHYCEKDQDCVTQVGWEYTCENVGVMKTKWPAFDSNGFEIPDSEQTGMRISTLVGSDAIAKRCVYRGRGAACMPNYTNINANASYIQEGNTTTTGNDGLFACAPNFYCQNFISGGDVSLFNNKISRFGKSPNAQNLDSDLEQEVDSFGQGARFIGRPYDYNGKEKITSVSAKSNLNSNKVSGMCIPGHAPATTTAETFLTNNSRKPAASGNELFEGDKVLNIGMTTSGTSAAKYYLSACGIFNDSGNYLYKTESGTDMGSDPVAYRAAAQVSSTNALAIFDTPNLGNVELTKFFNTEFIESFYYQKNRCLRMPGSACFSDQDCVANSYISTALAESDPEQSIFDGVTSLNSYELRFWQSELICGQEVLKNDVKYDLKKNRCCRDLGKEFYLPQAVLGTGVFSATDPSVANGTAQTPLILSNTTSVQRNSTIGLYAKEMIDNTNLYPNPPAKVRVDQCTSAGTSSCAQLDVSGTGLKYQFNTMSKVGEKLCCSGHWVRNWHEDNGGGHKWEQTKAQTFDSAMFRCMNWNPCNPGDGAEGSGDFCSGDGTVTGSGFSCSHVEDMSDTRCLIRNISQAESKRIMNAVSRFELLGIPQVPIHSPSSHARAPGSTDNYLNCRVNPQDQKGSGYPNSAGSDINGNFIIPNLFKLADPEDAISNGNAPDTREIAANSATGNPTTTATGNGQFYSAGDLENFDEENLKPIFSADKLSCCKPAGTIMNPGDDPNTCCTGFVNAQQRRCSLPDYTSVTVYTNRYVSSALKDIDIESQLSGENRTIYEHTGYVNDPSILTEIACNLKLCDSGVMAMGVAWGPYGIPGYTGQNTSPPPNRFLQGSGEQGGLDSYFSAGMHWNTHVYCVPDEIVQQQAQLSNLGVVIRNCNL